jgi:hypothetical protein
MCYSHVHMHLTRADNCLSAPRTQSDDEICVNIQLSRQALHSWHVYIQTPTHTHRHTNYLSLHILTCVLFQKEKMAIHSFPVTNIMCFPLIFNDQNMPVLKARKYLFIHPFKVNTRAPSPCNNMSSSLVKLPSPVFTVNEPEALKELFEGLHYRKHTQYVCPSNLNNDLFTCRSLHIYICIYIYSAL